MEDLKKLGEVIVPLPKKITINDQKVLGLGSGGTVVYEGTLN